MPFAGKFMCLASVWICDSLAMPNKLRPISEINGIKARFRLPWPFIGIIKIRNEIL